MRIAIVNDLALAREVLRRLVASVPGHVVAWTAADGEEAVRKAAKDSPDIILMDLVMPVMDGVEATRRIMAANPCPILLVTSTVTGNYNLVFRAMGHGGLDAVNTPTLGADGKIKDGEGILDRIAKLARARQLPAQAAPVSVPPPRSTAARPSSSRSLTPLLALGASTGGPEALARVLHGLPVGFPVAVLVVQHIAADFAPGLARWLSGHSPLPVHLAADGSEPRAGEVLVAATNDHLLWRSDHRLGYTKDPIDLPYRPSVDVCFRSLAAGYPRRGVAVVLTGMGNDGAQGMLELCRAGWYTIAQDQATCVVHGMPRAAAELGAVRQVLPLDRISAAIVEEFHRQGAT